MGCWSSEWREAVSSLLMDRGMIDKASRWDACGKDYLLAVCNKHPGEHEPTVVPVTCGLRVCPLCVKRERERVVRSFKPLFKAVRQGKFGGRYGYRFKHLVLTARREEGDLRGQLRRLVKNARALIKHFWARGGWRGRGAVMTVEAGPKGGNVHVHVFLYGQYVDVYRISERWEELTGNCVVFIRACDVKTLKEVIKYPYKMDGVSPEGAVDFLVALNGFKRMRTYGIFYKGGYRDMGSGGGGGIKCPVCGADTTVMSVSFYEERYGVRVAFMPGVREAIARFSVRPP